MKKIKDALALAKQVMEEANPYKDFSDEELRDLQVLLVHMEAKRFELQALVDRAPSIMKLPLEDLYSDIKFMGKEIAFSTREVALMLGVKNTKPKVGTK